MNNITISDLNTAEFDFLYPLNDAEILEINGGCLLIILALLLIASCASC